MAVALNASEGVLVGHYVLFACRFMARRGHTAGQVLDGTGLHPAELEQYPAYLVSLPAVLRILRNLETLEPSPTLPLELGSQLNLGSHGFLGYAFQASPTLGEALVLAHRFTLTRTHLLQLSFSRTDARATLEIGDNGLLGPWFPKIIETLLACFFAIGTDLLGNLALDQIDLQLSFPEQPHHLALQALAEGHARFSCSTTSISFPAEWLAIALPSPDPQLAALAAARCSEELLNAERSVDLLTRIKKLARQHLADPNAQEQVAAALNITPRTLHRRMREQGMNFKALLDDLRRSAAAFKLRHETSAIAEIAAELGYSDQANFVRAFKRWTGTTPSRFRQG